MSIEKAKVRMASYSTTKTRVLQLDPRDNVLVALTDLGKGERISFLKKDYVLSADVPAKHKFVTADVAAGGEIIMYGVLVGKATEALRPGDLLSTRNLRHDAARCLGVAHKNLRRVPPSRWPSGFAELLDRASAGVLRKPQSCRFEASV